MEHAVVLGAGMAGLCAARALAGHFEKVTVVERDRLPSVAEHGAAPRRGVPQGRHVHALLGTGGQALERLFPGVTEELVSAGAVRSGLLADSRYVLGGAALARGDARVSAVQATRPLLEAGVRERVRALSGVTFLEGYDVLEPVFEDRAVTGARVQRRPDGNGGTEPEVLPAALVVDATGRAGRAAGWLAAEGFGTPPEDRTEIDVGYATRFVRMPPEALDGDRTVLTGNVPAYPGRGCALFLQEEGRWIFTLAGMGGDHPPTDEEGFHAFARTVLPADLYEAVRGAEALDAPVFHRFPYSVRRRFERLESYPEGLVAAGDSMCSFNPVYGQGMSVAAQEAEALDSCLSAGRSDLPRRYFTEAARAVAPAWEMALSADSTVPQIGGRRPLGKRIMGRYLERLLLAAHRDPELAALYVRVVSLLDPPTRLLAPGVVLRSVRGSRGRPAHHGADV